MPHWPVTWPLQPVPARRWAAQRPTHPDADPAIIDTALTRALGRPSGNWYVLGASHDIRAHRPFGATIATTELVAWRDGDHRVRVGPGACPHLGAPLAQARTDRGDLVCRWHGLQLCAADWGSVPSHDDGVLTWVRLDGDENVTSAPVIPQRPTGRTVDAVTT